MEKLRKQGPVETVTNRDDYRYTLAEENPNIAESFRERLIESGVFLSREDRSPFINLSKDRLSAWTEKGFLSPLCFAFVWIFPNPLLTFDFGPRFSACSCYPLVQLWELVL